MRDFFSRIWTNSLGAVTLVLIALLLGGYLMLVEASRPSVGGDALRFDTFIDLAEQDRINNAEILDEDSYVIGSYESDDGTDREYNTPYLKTLNNRERLVQTLTDNRVPLTIDQQFTKSLVQPASILLPALIVAVIFAYFIVSYFRGTGLFGLSSGARKIKQDESRATFADVAGQDAAVGELREVSQYLGDPKRFAEMGARTPRGILLYGPPGCGKTLIARALAGESGASFYSISGSDFVELYVGVGAARVRDLFKEAGENAPAIIFIDELDALGRRRGGADAPGSGSAAEQEQALNQILAEMDGFSAADGVIVIASTNRPDVLDPALLRPGRFDRAIGMERVDEKGRLEILQLHAQGSPLAADADLLEIARNAHGMTGADLAALINEAGLIAARADSRSISHENLVAALNRVREEPERQRRLAQRGRTVGSGALAEEKVRYSDVAGVDEAIEELAEVGEFLRDPERFEKLGARIPRGYLFIGPPGCGKTMLARAVASEAGAAFVSVAGSEFTEVLVGEGAARVRDLFAEARAMSPAIVFIDEIDAIGARRGSTDGSGHREREQTLNQILIELDGFTQRTGVLAMAATNRADILDPALVRPGRFDRTITIHLPDRDAREEILAVHARGKKLAKDVDLSKIARLSRGLSGADLANVLNEAALLTARQSRKTIPMERVEEGLERVMLGIRGSHRVEEVERRSTAYHEAGHALVGMSLDGAQTPHRVSVIPRRGLSLGETWSFDEMERNVYPKSVLLDRIATLLAGRAAEELVLGEPGSGAANDLAEASRIARAMVRDLGMSDLGVLTQDRHFGEAQLSDQASSEIDTEARKILDQQAERALKILKRERTSLDRTAAALLEEETLTAEQIEQIVQVAGARAR